MNTFNSNNDPRHPVRSFSLWRRAGVKASRPSSREKGFTLVELLIAMALMALVTAAVYQLYISQYKTWASQDLITEMQQNARVAIDTISRDMLQAGYNVSQAIDDAGSNLERISIKYLDMNDGLYKRVSYWKDGETLLRKVEEKSSESAFPGLTWDNGDVLSENVVGFSIAYFDANGASLGSASNAYRVKVTVQVKTSKIDPVTTKLKYLTLSSDIRPRNIGITGVTIDTEKPADITTVPVVIDPNICGTLDVAWASVSDADLAGYNLYVRPASLPTYPSPINLGKVTTYTLTGLDNGIKYYIAVTARDKSGNESDNRSPDAHGDGVTSEDGSISPVNDTTPDANVPGKPVWKDAAASATTEGSPKVTLNWKANTETYPDDTDVSKYEVWRSPHESGTWTKLGDTAATTYTDSTLNEADKCSVFDYRIRAINICTNAAGPYSDDAYGDADLGSGITDTPTDGTTSTRPRDGTAPAGPVNLKSRAGYKRTYLNWDNVSDADLQYVWIKYIEGGTGPNFDSGLFIENALTPQGQFAAVPDAKSQPFTHTGNYPCADPKTPLCLVVGQTYAYSFFSEDRCGNRSDATQKTETPATQCGEEINPVDPSTGAPPKPTNFTVSNSCNTYDFSWDRVDDHANLSDPALSGVSDLAGFYPYKSTTGSFNYNNSDTKAITSLIINEMPPGILTWSDAALGDYPDEDALLTGKTYMYYLMSIDCNREENHSADPWLNLPEDLITGKSPTRSDVIAVKPGRTTFGNNTSVATGYIKAPTFANNTSTGGNNYYHNTVDVTLRNTSTATVKLKNMDVSWGNSASRLKRIYRKNADSTLTEIWSSASPIASGTTVTFNAGKADLGGYGVAGPLSPAVVSPWRLRFVFTDASGNVTSSQDMRAGFVSITNLVYEKVFSKEGADLSAGSCTARDVNGGIIAETADVPTGPALYDNETMILVASNYELSTATTGAYELDANETGEIYTRVKDTDFKGIQSVKLYYKTTDKTQTTAPVSGYTELSPASVLGSYYRFTIPSKPDKRIWYYIIARDRKGNFDRTPEVQNGVYTYDQNAANICDVTPSEPSLDIWGGSTANVGANTVTLSWWQSDVYDDWWTERYSSDTFSYRVYRRDSFSGSYNLLTTGGCRSSSINCTDWGGWLSCTCTDDGTSGLNVNTGDNSYYVETINACVSPGPKVSTPSSVYTECAGVGGGRLLSVDNTSVALNEWGWGWFQITINDCATAADGGWTPTDVVNNLDIRSASGRDDDNVTVYEDSAGTYHVGISTYLSTTNCDSWDGNNTPWVWSYICVDSTDTITVTLPGAGGSPIDVAITPPPPPAPHCWDAPPATPTGFTLNQGTDKSAASVTLSWNANTDWDLNGYSAYGRMSEDGGTTWSAWSQIANCQPNAAATSCTAWTSDGRELKDALYEWQLYAVDTCPLFSNPTASVQETFVCSGTMDAPTGLNWSYASKNDRYVTLTWNLTADPDISGFMVKSKKTGDASWIVPPNNTCQVGRTTVTCTAGTSDNGQIKSAEYHWKLIPIDYCSPANQLAIGSAPEVIENVTP